MTDTQRPDEHEHGPEHGSEHEPVPETVEEAGDSMSDPSLDSGETADWAAEGGAIPDGPATDPSAG